MRDMRVGDRKRRAELKETMRPFVVRRVVFELVARRHGGVRSHWAIARWSRAETLASSLTEIIARNRFKVSAREVVGR